MKKIPRIISYFLIMSLLIGETAFAIGETKIGYEQFSAVIPFEYEVYTRSDAQYVSGIQAASSLYSFYLDDYSELDGYYFLCINKDEDTIFFELLPTEQGYDLNYYRNYNKLYLDILQNYYKEMLSQDGNVCKEARIVETENNLYFAFNLEDAVSKESSWQYLTFGFVEDQCYIALLYGDPSNSANSNSIREDLDFIAENIVFAGYKYISSSELQNKAVFNDKFSDIPGMKAYYLNAGPLSLTLDDDNYIILTKGMQENEPDMINSGMDYQNYIDYFTMFNNELYMYKNSESVPPHSTICVRIKDGKYPGKDYRKMPFSQVLEETQEMYETFPGATDYEVVTINDVPYFKFYWNSGTELRYATIVNSDMIYYYVKNDKEVLSEEEENALLQLVESVIYQ